MPRLHLVRHGEAAAGWDADLEDDRVVCRHVGNCSVTAVDVGQDGVFRLVDDARVVESGAATETEVL